MNNTRIVVAILLAFWAFFYMRFAEPSSSNRKEEIRRLVESTISYLGLKNQVTADQINKLTELRLKAESPNITDQERISAFQELFTLFQTIQGNLSSSGTNVASLAQAAARWTNFPPRKRNIKTTEAGNLGDIKKHGSGKIRVVLIPDNGYDGSVYESLMKRNESRYTMAAVTLAGFGVTNPPPLPSQRDYAKTSWWNSAETGIVQLLQKENWKDVVLVGHQAGAYLAIKLALDHPEQIASVISINGLLYPPINSTSDPKRQATREERIQMFNSSLPGELFPVPTPDQYRKFLEGMGGWLCKTKECQDALITNIIQSESGVWWNYNSELMTTDLSDEIKKMKVPILSIVSIHDQASPGASYSKTTLDQWQTLKNTAPDLALTIVSLQDTRSVPMYDSPEKLDQAIAAFLQ